MEMFKAICGKNALSNVVILTTYWDRVTEEEGAGREIELLESEALFKQFTSEGAISMRNDRLKDGIHFIEHLLRKSPVSLQILDEMNSGKTLADTSAGSILLGELKTVIKKHEEELEDPVKETEVAVVRQDHELRKQIDEEVRQMQFAIDRASMECDKLESSIIRQHQNGLQGIIANATSSL